MNGNDFRSELKGLPSCRNGMLLFAEIPAGQISENKSDIILVKLFLFTWLSLAFNQPLINSIKLLLDRPAGLSTQASELD